MKKLSIFEPQMEKIMFVKRYVVRIRLQLFLLYRMVRECRYINIYESMVQLNSNVAPPDIKFVRFEEGSYPDGRQDT